MRRLADAMTSLARGDFATKVDGLARRDEIGIMARSVADRWGGFIGRVKLA
jgi:HAMP domain-containing protein